MSRALERLRVVLGDELLVRRDGYYELTPRAEKLRIELEELLPQIDTAIRGIEFDPAQSRERFRVITHEYASVVLLPAVVRTLAATAPCAVVEVELWHAGAIAQVEAGALDLAISGLDLTVGLELMSLLPDELVCVVAEDHPWTDRQCSLPAYVQFPHVSIAVENGRQPWIDGPLRNHGLTRRISYRTPSLAAAALALPGTQMILTTGRRWFEAFGAFLPLRAVEAPPEFSPFRYGMAWHSRLTSHPAHSWFRDVVSDEAQHLSELSPVRPSAVGVASA